MSEGWPLSSSHFDLGLKIQSHDQKKLFGSNEAPKDVAPVNNQNAYHGGREVPISGNKNSLFDEISIGFPMKECYIITPYDMVLS